MKAKILKIGQIEKIQNYYKLAGWEFAASGQAADYPENTIFGHTYEELHKLSRDNMLLFRLRSELRWVAEHCPTAMANASTPLPPGGGITWCRVCAANRFIRCSTLWRRFWEFCRKRTRRFVWPEPCGRFPDNERNFRGDYLWKLLRSR